MKAAVTAEQVITGNDLASGSVVFQTDRGWSTNIAEAEILTSSQTVATALARAAAATASNRVVDAYAIDVARTEAGLVPARLRERIRATGPTTGNSLPGNLGSTAA
jgi:hypothetical protein